MTIRLLVMGVLVLIIPIPFTAMAEFSPPAQTAAEKQPEGKTPAIGVDALMKNPESHKGVVRLRGVVRSAFPKEQRLGLIDESYLGCCPSTSSCAQVLPVKWTGEMPPRSTLVMITGEIQRTKEKLEFVAQTIERIEPAAGTPK